MRDDVNLSSTSVRNYRLGESPQVLQVLFWVDLILRLLFVSGTPCCNVELALLVALREEVLDRLRESSEETFSSNCDVWVAMEKDDRFMLKNILVGCFAAICTSHEVQTLETIFAVAVGI